MASIVRVEAPGSRQSERREVFFLLQKIEDGGMRIERKPKIVESRGASERKEALDARDKRIYIHARCARGMPRYFPFLHTTSVHHIAA
jgi:hypothetical protein